MTATTRALAALRSLHESPLLRCFPDGALLVFDLDLRFISAGNSPLGAAGPSREQVEGNTIAELFPAEVVTVLEPRYRQALAGVAGVCDVPYRDRILRQRLAPLADSTGAVVAGICFTEDVTDAHRAEQARRVSEEHFRMAFDSGPVGLAMVSLEGRFQQVNDAMCAFTGYRREGLLGLPVEQVDHPDDVGVDRDARAELLSGKLSGPVEKRYLTPDGSSRWGLTSAVVVRDENGVPLHFIDQVVDITARKLDEQQILDERRRRRDAESIGRTGAWEMDVRTRALHWSDGMFALWGIEPEKFGGDYAAATGQVHPDDRDALDAAVAACVTGDEPLDITIRVFRATDGAMRWIACKGEGRYLDGRRVRIGGVVADVTDQRLAADEAAAAHIFQEAVFAASPDVIAVWDLASWSVVWSNREITEHLGYSAAEAAAISGDLAANLVLPEDYHALMASVEAVRNCADGQVAEVNFRMLHRDGTPRWFSRRAAPLRRDEDGRVLSIVGVSRDISEAKDVEAALVESQTAFRELAESVDVAFALRSWETEEFLYVSPAFPHIFGFDPAAGARVQVSAVVHADDLAGFERDYLSRVRAGIPATATYRIVRPDGEVRWIRTKSSPVRGSAGKSRRSASTSEDITATVQTEAALQSAREAEKANAAKNEFLSRMSHELRTPLNAVLGFAQLLELDDLTGDQRNATRHILDGGRHLLGLIDDVLEISKIESDRLETSMENVCVADLLTETVELMTLQAKAAGIALVYHPPPGVRRSVPADRRRLRQVVLNLLSNAIKYNQPGGRVDVRCRGADGRLLIEVADTGRGIRPELLPRLFTPFDRLDAGPTGVEGTGVGLALSQRLMTLMGGRLDAASVVGAGSVFTASFPLADGRSPAPAASLDRPAGARPAPRPPGRSAQKTVLYIEDNAPNVELLRRLLAHRPHWSMLVAGDGALGLRLASTTTPQPDLVLLDLHLPDMNGLDVLRRLRSAPGTAELDVVVVTADANRHQIDQLLAAGAKAYLTKPLEILRLLDVLD